ncbi:glutathione S-transferase family protein [Shinella curvata]|uniref:Glutathione S-transferase family protein n=1 Tax=Shinella curvata TaxID=1817964 RepID=A0ABT8XAF2_9HYPH|nr:glutathione S-transferase family protein [Shinella curvata]MCJ8051822.1 glutathione S-transferase family protein [Shinella curvata]MDO6120230.1 glutathione S-transferase family protein [Shinella curvata]
MILIGQYDSSYVRRVGIALRLHDLPFEHRPWSVFSEGEKVQAVNPLMRVPTLVLDDGDVVADSGSILDYLDGLVPAEKRLLPQAQPQRRQALKVMTFATGFADKGVSLFYELHLHETPSAYFVERCRAQILTVLTALEAERATRPGTFWFGRITHADIAVACAWRHMREAHPGLIDETAYPALASHCAGMEALPVFQEMSQPFIAPA